MRPSLLALPPPLHLPLPPLLLPPLVLPPLVLPPLVLVLVLLLPLFLALPPVLLQTLVVLGLVRSALAAADGKEALAPPLTAAAAGAAAAGWPGSSAGCASSRTCALMQANSPAGAPRLRSPLQQT